MQIIGPYLEDRTTLTFASLVKRERGGFVAPPASCQRRGVVPQTASAPKRRLLQAQRGSARPDQRRLRGLRGLRGAAGGFSAFAQKFVTCFTPSVVAVCAALFASRLTAAVVWPRAWPITVLAALSHMLMNGFFLVHGFFIGCPWSSSAGGGISFSRTCRFMQ